MFVIILFAMFCHVLPFFAIEKNGPPFTHLPPPWSGHHSRVTDRWISTPLLDFQVKVLSFLYPALPSQWPPSGLALSVFCLVGLGSGSSYAPPFFRAVMFLPWRLDLETKLTFEDKLIGVWGPLFPKDDQFYHRRLRTGSGFLSSLEVGAYPKGAIWITYFNELRGTSKTSIHYYLPMEEECTRVAGRMVSLQRRSTRSCRSNRIWGGLSSQPGTLLLPGLGRNHPVTG